MYTEETPATPDADAGADVLDGVVHARRCRDDPHTVYHARPRRVPGRRAPRACSAVTGVTSRATKTCCGR